jgi:hypothetical protein
MVATCSGGTGGFSGGGGGGGVVVSTCTTGGGATGGGGGGFLQLIAMTNEAKMINSTKCFTFTGTSLENLFLNIPLIQIFYFILIVLRNQLFCF